MRVLFLAVYLTATSVGCGQAPSVDYPAPDKARDLLGWAEKGRMRYLDPNERTSPRFIQAVTGPDFNVFDHDAAVRDLVKDTGVQFVGMPTLEPLEAWRKYDGRDMRVAFSETRYAGRRGVGFLLISKMAGRNTFGIWFLEITEETFADWGGAARMLLLRDVIQSKDDIPQTRRGQVATAPLDQQTRFYEIAVNAQYEAVGRALLGMVQMNTFTMMQNLNYDLAFGRDLDPSPHGPD